MAAKKTKCTPLAHWLVMFGQTFIVFAIMYAVMNTRANFRFIYWNALF